MVLSQKFNLMRLGNKTTCVFNMLHNLQGLGPSPPTFGANNIIVVSWVITPTLLFTNMQSGRAGD